MCRSHFYVLFSTVHMVTINSLEGTATEQQLLPEIGKGRTILTKAVLFEFIMRCLYNI